MDELTKIILYTLGAGACIPLGGILANREKIHPNWLENEFRHAVIAFGGGILIAAVALVLVPEGIKYVNHSALSAITLLCGGISFFALERYLGAHRREKPQFTAMLLDYVPESLALGGAFAVGAHSAPLLAMFIGLQNLPEGFNAYRELNHSKVSSPQKILTFMLLLVPIGPVIAIFGWVYFSHNSLLLGATMLYASGGILYLIFQDIAPQAHMKRHWAPPLGAVIGFSVGMLGSNIVEGNL
ncbi:MAG: divalent cation transporter [Sedimenticola sp.]|uniref:Divalent cation transporter n=1 Tax=Sedimenticola thiotaurini TaxID=1543721 RepID=A0A558DBT4_9GAMM|nr:divalent cation transporter [Sedimenticola sp.]TVT58495.1 MAG: divalent cation transporter [Sedimenticola thiotaurini]